MNHHHNLDDARPVHRCRHCDTQLEGKIFVGGNGHLYCNSLCSINAIADEIAARKAAPPRPFRQVSEASPNHPSKRQYDPVSRYVITNVPEVKLKTPSLYPPTRPPKSDVRAVVDAGAGFVGFFLWLAVVSLFAAFVGIPLFL